MRKLFLATCTLFLSATAGNAGLLLDVPIFDGSNSGSSTGFNYGWTFSVSTPIVISGLALWDANPTGLADAHEVGLWTAGGVLLASATVDNSGIVVSSTSVYGRWIYTPISHVVLTPGTYVLGEHQPSPSDALLILVNSPVMAPGTAYVDSNLSGPTVSPAMPALNTGYKGLFGPNAIVSEVPEPGTMALAAAGLLLAAAARFRRA